MNNKTELPHRFREESFRKYEMILNNAVQAWPNAVKADPHLFNVAQVTFACRCRDAKKSLHDHHWETMIDMQKFEAIQSKLEVSERTDGTVLIGSAEAISKFAAFNTNMTIIPPVPEHSGNTPIFTLAGLEAKELLMKLSSARLLAPRIYVQGITQDEVVQFQMNYDTAIDKHDDKTYVIIT